MEAWFCPICLHIIVCTVSYIVWYIGAHNIIIQRSGFDKNKIKKCTIFANKFKISVPLKVFLRSLMYILGRCYSKHIHLNHHQALRYEQHGFRQHRSCDTQLITTIHDFTQCLNQQGQCDVLLLDFCKAFDKVPHSCLFHKLQLYGIKGTLLSWIKNFLPDHSQKVMLDNKVNPVLYYLVYCSSSSAFSDLYQWPSSTCF